MVKAGDAVKLLAAEKPSLGACVQSALHQQTEGIVVGYLLELGAGGEIEVHAVVA